MPSTALSPALPNPVKMDMRLWPPVATPELYTVGAAAVALVRTWRMYSPVCTEPAGMVQMVTFWRNSSAKVLAPSAELITDWPSAAPAVGCSML